ncbi:hypothetical protein HD806DRAFT_541943 [Xylariaceae sp. AK1471]|nr:hypothetical protein HD806DRAFT_541943 [Xylariaceae sp. AK1471]
MTRTSIVSQFGDGSQDSIEKVQQNSGAFPETQTGNTSPRQGGDQLGSRALVASNLESLEKGTPLSDWLGRNDDPFPYGNGTLLLAHIGVEAGMELDRAA